MWRICCTQQMKQQMEPNSLFIMKRRIEVMFLIIIILEVYKPFLWNILDVSWYIHTYNKLDIYCLAAILSLWDKCLHYTYLYIYCVYIYIKRERERDCAVGFKRTYNKCTALRVVCNLRFVFVTDSQGNHARHINTQGCNTNKHTYTHSHNVTKLPSNPDNSIHIQKYIFIFTVIFPCSFLVCGDTCSLIN